MIRPTMLHLVALTLAAAEAPGQDLQREIAALRPKDVSAQEASVLDNLQERANRGAGRDPAGARPP